jgi:hypothetical protein
MVFATFLEEIEARTRIEDALKRYCRGIDRNDYELAASAYHQGATDRHGSANGTAEEFLASSRRRHDGMEHSLHVITNVQIDFTSTRAAVVECYLLSYQRFAASATVIDGAGRPVAGPHGARTLRLARYLDEFEEREGDWRIVARAAVYGDEFVTPVVDEVRFPDGYAVQRMDDGDPLWRLLGAGQ